MKAIVGSWDHRPYHVLAELTALRARVRDLERALERAHEENAALRAALEQRPTDLDDLEELDEVVRAESVEVSA